MGRTRFTGVVRASYESSWFSPTTPLGLVGAVPASLTFQQPFGFDAILGLIGLSGILLRTR